MKKIAIILFIFLSLSGFSKIIVWNYLPTFKTPFEKIINVVASDIVIDTSKNITIYLCEAKFGGLNEEEAIVRTQVKGVYIINITSRMTEEQKIIVFIHELIHISQIENGRLKTGKNYVYFEDKLYTNKTAYLERPYEVEALKLSNKLYWKYRKQF